LHRTAAGGSGPFPRPAMPETNPPHQGAPGVNPEQSNQLPDISWQQEQPPDRSSRSQSPLLRRHAFSTRSLLEHSGSIDETSSLLDNADVAGLGRSYRSIAPSSPGTPRPQRQLSYSTNTRFSRNVSRRGSFSFSQRLVNALGAEGTILHRRDTGGHGE
jgi:hypothetical protein